MADFTQILVDPFMISYASPRGAPKTPVRTLDPKTEARFSEVLRGAFISTMRNSRGFTLVDEASPEAIRVQGWLYDLVVAEPPTDDRRNFPLCFAEVSVILTVRHSQTAQALARVAERTALTCRGEPDARYYTTNWSTVREGVKPWAKSLRRWIEDLSALPPISE